MQIIINSLQIIFMQLLKDTFRYNLTLIFLVIFILNANLYGASDKLYNGFYVGSVVKDSVGF